MKALITGITGQDGSYLAELLLSKGYEVHGIIRRSSSFNTGRLDNIFSNLKLHYGDVTDALSVDMIIGDIKPDEIYHLGAQSHVKVSFEIPGYTAQCDAIGTLNILEAMRKHARDARLYNASTSELYGEVLETPQNEKTPFNPRSPYGVAKLYSYYIVKNYREAYGMFCVNGILFNHESERRGSTFVTKKITEGLAAYVNYGIPFYLGNIEAKRDWGYAPDFVKGMWLMLQQDKPEDFVLATGETHTIKEFIDECLDYIPKSDNYIWAKLGGEDLALFDDYECKTVIGRDEKYYRPAEVDILLGDATKAKEKLGWEAKTKFKELVKIMMQNEL
jgi:GDPmannose 4,6-dehydratase